MTTDLLQRITHALEVEGPKAMEVRILRDREDIDRFLAEHDKSRLFQEAQENAKYGHLHHVHPGGRLKGRF